MILPIIVVACLLGLVPERAVAPWAAGCTAEDTHGGYYPGEAP